jgi:hypothetical protein
MTKTERDERQAIIDLVKAEWTGKNTFRLKTDPAIVFQVLLDHGFTSSRIPFNESHPTGFSFNVSRNNFSWFIKIALRDFLNTLPKVFKFIDSLENNGYSGSNEWKVDVCAQLGVPRTGDLAYLKQPGKYWFVNELCTSPEHRK